MKKYMLGATVFLLLSFCMAHANLSQKQVVDTSVDILNDISQDKHLNVKLKNLKDLEAIAILPNTVKTGFIITGHSGKGIFLLKKRDGQWGSPVFVNFKGTGAGIKAGYESTDLVLLFMTKRSYQGIADGKATIDATADMSIVKNGYRAAGLTDAPELAAQVYSFGKSSGIFMGMGFDASILEIDDEKTNDYYGRLFEYEDILNDSPKESVHTRDLKNTLVKIFN